MPSGCLTLTNYCTVAVAFAHADRHYKRRWALKMYRANGCSSIPPHSDYCHSVQMYCQRWADVVAVVVRNLSCSNKVYHLLLEPERRHDVENWRTVEVVKHAIIIGFSSIIYNSIVQREFLVVLVWFIWANSLSLSFKLYFTWLCWFCSAIAFSLACRLHLYLWFWNHILTWNKKKKHNCRYCCHLGCTLKNFKWDN